MKMKVVITFVIIICSGIIDRAAAYPFRPSHRFATDIGARSPKLENSINEKQHKKLEVDSMSDLTQLLQLVLKDRAVEQVEYNDPEIEMEGITSFFNNLGEKFREFGKRMKHAFRPSGK